MIKEAIYKLINHKDLTYEESLAVMGEMAPQLRLRWVDF